ncbi:MAG TPA: CsgG/HfaB family protein [Kiritimatiellia bacterium]|nr:CsgG/HfaB family protein [Kiritimatiellia bacterium]
MKRTWICLAGLAAALAGCAAPTGYSSGGAGTGEPNVYVAREAFGVEKVGILPFKAATALVGGSVSDLFVTELMKMNRYELVERAQMSGVLGETEVALSGLTSGQAAQLGQMIGADGVIVGTVSEYELVAQGGRTYPTVGISIRLIDAGTGKILWSVDHAARGGKSDTLAQHARAVVRDMAAALDRQLR